MPKNIYDIAKAAGVSIATVSRVFNDKGQVKKSTKEKVLTVADEMGYHPQVFAQGLARKKKNSIVMFVPIMSNYFFMEILGAIQDKLSSKNFELNILHVIAGGDAFEQVEYQLKRQWADGYIFVSIHFSKSQWKSFERFDVPISVIDDSCHRFDSVAVDNVEGSYLATNYFIDKGFTKIANLTAEPTAVPVMERLEGYKNALEEAGICLDENLIKRGDDMSRDGFNEKSGYEGMKKILNIDPLPEACICASDIKAIGALKAMEDLGISIPIISYDNLTIAKYVGLSTVHQPMYEMGTRATESLLSRIETPSLAASKTIFKPELIIRSSSE